MQLIPGKKDKLEYEFLPEALEVIETPPSKASRAIIWSIFLIMVVAITWACIGEVDEVATSRGKIILDGRTKVVQSNTSGVIKEIFIKEGQVVSTGDPMFLLDDEKQLQDISTLKEEVSVLQEEVNIYTTLLNGGNPKGSNSSYGMAIISKNNAHVQTENEMTLLPSQYETQKELELQQIEKNKSEVEMLEENKKLMQAKYNSPLSQELGLEKLNVALKSLQTEEKRIERLVESGVAPNIELQKLQDEIKLIEEEIKIQQNIIDTERMNQNIEIEKINSQIDLANKEIILKESSIKQIDEKIVASKESLITYSSQKESSYRESVSVNEKKIIEMIAQINKIEKDIEDLKIVASTTGVVENIANNTIGGIVTPAQVLATIVPKDEPLTVEAYLQNKDIGFVNLGQDVSVKFDTFSYQKYGFIKGEVIYISPDAKEIENIGVVYVIKIKLQEKSIKIEEKIVNFVPGMTVTAEVVTGKRKIIEFFLEPLVKYVEEGFNLR